MIFDVKRKTFYYKTSDGYEIDFVTQDLEGQYEMIQVVWDASAESTFERETRAIKQAEAELGIPGRLIDWKTYLSEN